MKRLSSIALVATFCLGCGPNVLHPTNVTVGAAKEPPERRRALYEQHQIRVVEAYGALTDAGVITAAELKEHYTLNGATAAADLQEKSRSPQKVATAVPIVLGVVGGIGGGIGGAVAGAKIATAKTDNLGNVITGGFGGGLLGAVLGTAVGGMVFFGIGYGVVTGPRQQATDARNRAKEEFNRHIFKELQLSVSPTPQGASLGASFRF